jgi:hypothetical protein
MPGRGDTLRVILAAFSTNIQINNHDADFFGVTEDGQRAQMPVKDFIVLNTTRINPDNATLIHEMIHASDPPGQKLPHDEDPTSVFAQSAPGRVRTVLKPEHAQRISEAYFAQPFHG